MLSAQTDTTKENFLLVGTYTKSAEEGINVYAFNTTTGKLRFVSTAKDVNNPSYLVIAPDHQHVYTVNENDEGGVSAFAWDTVSGNLTFLNKQISGGAAPCYITTDADGKYVIVGNYSGGSLSVLPVREDGKIDAPVQTIEHTGRGPNKERQEKPHVHCVVFGPDKNTLYVSDLGIDQVVIYNYKQGDVLPLVPADTGYAALAPGAGPRHLTFHPNGKWAYIIHELDGKVTAFNYVNKKLVPFQTISMLPAGYKGPVSGADIHISPDGKFLYASNREKLNNIVIYSIDRKNGQLVKKGEQPTGGKAPRNFMIDPDGNFLLVANQNTDNVVVFKRNKLTGLLTSTGQEIKVPKPVCLKMIGTN
ncbi:lactonase family protein [Chitinophaga agri]|nr:lactonase family protein [Chitinophaga agri]